MEKSFGKATHMSNFFRFDKFGHTLEIFGIIFVMKYEMCIERGRVGE